MSLISLTVGLEIKSITEIFSSSDTLSFEKIFPFTFSFHFLAGGSDLQTTRIFLSSNFSSSFFSFHSQSQRFFLSTRLYNAQKKEEMKICRKLNPTWECLRLLSSEKIPEVSLAFPLPYTSMLNDAKEQHRNNICGIFFLFCLMKRFSFFLLLLVAFFLQLTFSRREDCCTKQQKWKNKKEIGGNSVRLKVFEGIFPLFISRCKLLNPNCTSRIF